MNFFLTKHGLKKKTCTVQVQGTEVYQPTSETPHTIGVKNIDKENRTGLSFIFCPQNKYKNGLKHKPRNFTTLIKYAVKEEIAAQFAQLKVLKHSKTNQNL